MSIYQGCRPRAHSTLCFPVGERWAERYCYCVTLEIISVYQRVLRQEENVVEISHLRLGAHNFIPETEDPSSKVQTTPAEHEIFAFNGIDPDGRSGQRDIHKSAAERQQLRPFRAGITSRLLLPPFAFYCIRTLSVEYMDTVSLGTGFIK